MINSVLHIVTCRRCCNTALATAIYSNTVRADCIIEKQPTPSTVEVPRPSSSRITRLLSVAVCKISLVSDISAINVERPRANSSDAGCVLAIIKMR